MTDPGALGFPTPLPGAGPLGVLSCTQWAVPILKPAACKSKTTQTNPCHSNMTTQPSRPCSPAWPRPCHRPRAPWAWLFVLAWLIGGWSAAQAQNEALRLSSSADAVEAWPAVRVLADPDEALDTQTAWASRERFRPPEGPYANLGPRPGATWLIVPVQLDADAASTWVLRLQYALLHDVQLSVRDARGVTVHEARMGALVPFEQRAQKTRALSSLLLLRPGERYEVLLRVATPTGVLLPIAFMQQTALSLEESRAQAFQGVMTGVWGFMVVYSLLHGLLRRQGLFFGYAAALVASWLFAQAIYGVGPMFLWPGSAWLAANMSALAPLLMIPGSVLFLMGTLEVRRSAPQTARALLGLAIGTGLTAALFIGGVVSYRVAAAVSMALAVAHLALIVPLATQRLREGERAAIFVLAGAASNLVGAIAITLLLRGFLPVSFLTLHWVQFSFLAEMVFWMLVLGMRLEQLRQAAVAARKEHEDLQALAHTDALTGLSNRRGLDLALAAACRVAADDASNAPPALAVFMIDLDRFKPVNDRWGHDAGDKLLREVGRRLVAAVRPQDTVARLGGDEFVVASPGVRSGADAAVLGQKLLASFERSFDLGDGRSADVGATIGYALAGEQGCDTSRLLRGADAAMYAGKQAGKNRVMTLDPLRPGQVPWPTLPDRPAAAPARSRSRHGVGAAVHPPGR